ncbi:DUF1329 domain-containing protein [Noviherbaspirillum sedimenti]|uniref:DUF1329 domain-containing protein n=1 Tax=Noviherbaspirillum sedimenti TaxID=2320865 RepID=A0A3A3FY29_9BURK|nr:DUF1329 domain-containing protein [Noviherbaspirillum sedimenti]RJG00624.1 DUF1329 domain-containing protein [Noviherbaspirillum sedimenti]
MRKLTIIAALTSLTFSATAMAAPTPDQIKQLGTTLTPWGAEIAGNKDGTIPAYTGGMATPPAGFSPEKGKWVDPFPDDKKLFSIDAKNIDKYGDKVNAGLKELMKRYPDTFRMDIYPTRRSYPAQPKAYADAALANAKNSECKTESNGTGMRGCTLSTPFPIPSNGNEAMWNHLLRVRALSWEIVSFNGVSDSAGNKQTPYSFMGRAEMPYLDINQKPYDGGIGNYYYRGVTRAISPARDAGNTTLIWYPLQYDKDDQRTWSYTTGQRRVRLAPEFAYDTPVAPLAGVIFYDEAQMFAGRMDMHNFKLVGKKEMYVPYHAYKAIWAPIDSVRGKHHVNPDAMRYELHRVWVVEATLKDGKRHAVPKRIFYLDEDSWTVLVMEGYDQAGKLSRVQMGHSLPNYATGLGMVDFQSSLQAYDFAQGSYLLLSNLGQPESYYKPLASRNGQFSAQFSPEAVAGRGVR